MPYIGATAGAVAGGVTDMMARRSLAKDQEALAAVLGDIVETEQHESMTSRVRRIGGATLVVAGATVGMLNGLVWQTEADQSLPPTLGVIVDHSGAVQANDEVLSSVNSMTSMFDSDAFDATAYVAANGEVNPMKPNKVVDSEPFGDAPLEQAMTTAFGQNQKEREQTGNNNKTGIVAIVNGNQIGAPDAVIATAKTQQTAVFIANVEGKADPVVVQDLKRIAKETGGAYFDVPAEKTDEMKDKVADTLEKKAFKQDQPSRWPLRTVAGVLGVGTFIQGYRNRRKEPTYRNVKV